MNPLNSNTEAPVFKAPMVVSTPAQDQETEEIIWSEPVLIEDVKPPVLPVEALPSWLGEYVTAVSQSTQTPSDMALMLALSILATCFQGKVEISPVPGDYSEPVNIWTITALPPASRKSAVVKALTAPLIAWEKKEIQRMQPLIDAAETQKTINQKRINDLHARASKEEDKEKRRALAIEATELKENIGEEVFAPQLYTGDATPEELQNLLLKHGERMSVISDEGGIFEVMTGLYNNGQANIDVILQGHAGTSIRVNRGQRTVVMNNPALTMGLTVQPDVIARLNQGSKQRLRGTGALGRFLYAMPQSNVGSRNVRQSIPIDVGVKHVYETNIGIFLDQRPSTTVDGRNLHKLVLSLEALEIWRNFQQEIENELAPGGSYEPVADFAGKLPGAALRIAALFHCAETWLSVQEVSADVMDRAVQLCRPLITHAMLAFEMMALDPIVEDAKFIYKWITEQKSSFFVRSHLLKTARFKRANNERLMKPLALLAERGIISDMEKLETRKPTYIYRVNPLVSSAELAPNTDVGINHKATT